jgi:hypothetical protein
MEVSGIVMSKTVIFTWLMAARFVEVLVPFGEVQGRKRRRLGCSIGGQTARSGLWMGCRQREEEGTK